MLRAIKKLPYGGRFTLDKLQAVLQGTPPPWLRKALAKDGVRTFDFEEDTVAP